MLEIASSVAKRSSCDRAQVGCVVTNLEMTQIVAYGYNGNYRGGPNACDRPDEPGNCGCIHAEANALVKAPYDPGQLVLFATTCPCIGCAKLILNSRIDKVVFATTYRLGEGRRLLMDNNVTVHHVED